MTDQTQSLAGLLLLDLELFRQIKQGQLIGYLEIIKIVKLAISQKLNSFDWYISDKSTDTKFILSLDIHGFKLNFITGEFHNTMFSHSRRFTSDRYWQFWQYNTFIEESAYEFIQMFKIS